MRVLNLVRERSSENWSRIDTFIVEDYVTNPEKALRNAVKDFMQSEDGRKAVEYACGDFNWGDAITYITNDFLGIYGLTICEQDIETVLVDQDELLFPDIQEELLKSDE